MRPPPCHFPSFCPPRGSLTPKRGEDTSRPRLRPHAKFGVNRGAEKSLTEQTNKHTVNQIPRPSRMVGNKNILYVLNYEWFPKCNWYSLVSQSLTVTDCRSITDVEINDSTCVKLRLVILSLSCDLYTRPPLSCVVHWSVHSSKMTTGHQLTSARLSSDLCSLL